MDEVVVVAALPLIIDHGELKQLIRECESIDEFVRVYDSVAFQLVLRTIRVAQGIHPVDDWSKDWAIRMRTEPPADVEPNECRRTALTFIYELCNRWKDEECEDVTDERLVKDFKGNRVVNILQLMSLPMDRARALRKMLYPGKAAHNIDPSLAFYVRADGLLLDLHRHHPGLRSVQLSHVRFHWNNLSPLFGHIQCLTLDHCVLSDPLPLEVRNEGLLFTPDYRRHLEIDDELSIWELGGGVTIVGLAATCHMEP